MPNEENRGTTAWTVLKTLQWTAAYFSEHRLDTPRIDAEVLLAHTLKCERIDLYLRHDQPLTDAELARFKALIKRRLNHEPVAYIVGSKEFWSLRFSVPRGVLIPRPDTECLVETALSLLPAAAGQIPMEILELGAGTGAVIVTLAHERPGHRYWATDNSRLAIETARENARNNGVAANIRFFMSDWLAAVSPENSGFDLVISNPPYIASGDMASLAAEIEAHEPHGALDGGPDGLKDIRTIMAQARNCLKPGGHLLLEIGFDQRGAVQSLAGDFTDYEAPVFYKDHGGHGRVVRLRKKDIACASG